MYDSVNPYKVNRYPFFPVFGYYFPDYNDWGWKVQGMIRSMKDTQREKNKRRSNLMAAILTIPSSGVWYNEGAVEDPKQFDKSGPGVKWKVTGEINKDWGFLNPPALNIVQSLIQMEGMSDVDIQKIGPNPDMRGEIQDAGAPGVVVRMRKQAGMVSIMDMFDNNNQALINMGNCMIDMMNKNWKPWKIERILGKPLDPNFTATMGRDKYDCTIELAQSDPTYRMSIELMLQEYVKAGIQVPIPIIIEMSSLPPEVKSKWMQMLMMQMQAQAQAPPPPQNNEGA